MHLPSAMLRIRCVMRGLRIVKSEPPVFLFGCFLFGCFLFGRFLLDVLYFILAVDGYDINH
jgi:hypothetical protein